MSMAAAVRRMPTEPPVALVAGAHDALSALLVQEVGFDAVWASSFAISAARGLPDLSPLSMTDYLESASRMSEVCGVPVLADCDTGFGGNLNVAYLVRRYEAAGIGGVCIEDKVFPKRNSFIPGQALEDADCFARKIATAKGAQRDGDFVVVARTEAAIAGFGVEEAVRRCHRYVDAGADAVLMHSKSNKPAEALDFMRSWSGRAPAVVVPTNCSGSPASMSGWRWTDVGRSRSGRALPCRSGTLPAPTHPTSPTPAHPNPACHQRSRHARSA